MNGRSSAAKFRNRSCGMTGLAVLACLSPIYAEETSTLPTALRLSYTSLVPGPASPATPRGGCPQIVATHTDAQFPVLPDDPLPPQNFSAAGGIVETEILGASYTISASEFPITIDRLEMAFGHVNAAVTTTTEWSILVWEGTPDSGTLVRTISSDGFIVLHLVIPPGDQARVIRVDPDDLVGGTPIVVNDNGSQTFSVGFRIDRHHNPPTQDCDCIGQTCFTPAACCLHDTASNAFPLLDTSGLSAPTENWLFARDCGPFSITPGWHRFSDLNPTFSGDWVIQVTYEPTCIETAACCFAATGDCQALTQSDCSTQGGTWQGLGTTCAPNPCPQPGGACCNPATGFCFLLPLESDCLGFGGLFQGQGTTCTGPMSDECPTGACCLVDGSCVDGTPSDCAGLGGTFNASDDCASLGGCPQPTGACCLTAGGCSISEEIPCVGFGNTWAGAGTVCPDDCTPPCPGADGDMNQDSFVNGLDIASFLDAVINGATPEQECHGDFDGVNSVDVGDTSSFVAALIN